ncbi:tetratricopeptide repeat protein [Candidatus Reidiella endopervernicosa]|uniref:protein O-GlcNAc transferase n=1 Tax=Candidatus Reidiella endopervernicosa TaxID=2738883 RepID=A0A6N0HVM3_9GAMM|nr:tetratricopeptide repeat protein [Candidatus Reidiella endopervernicosa]QKQ26452.1 tetratricopeptide repeat protein [Candidatus Reidiella endopervernicosa]
MQQQINEALDYFHRGRFDKAVARISPLLKRQPKNPQLHLLLGAFNAGRGEHRRAIKSYEKALALEPQLLDARFNLGLAHQALEQFDEAERCFRQILNQHPNHPQSLNELGTALSAQQDYEAADEVFALAITAAPDFPAPAINRGLNRVKQGHFEEGIAAIELGLALDPNDAVALYNLGYAYEQMGQLDAALAAYLRTEAIAPDEVDTLNNLANLFSEQQRFDEALPRYKRCCELKPKTAEYLYNTGRCCNKMRASPEAIAPLEQAIALKPAYVEARIELGLALNRCDRSEFAITILEQAIKLDSASASTHAALGNCYMKLGHYPAGRAAFEQVLDLDPEDSASLRNLLMLLEYDPDADDAHRMRIAKQWGELAIKRAGGPRPHPAPYPKAPGEPLRIGYVSGDFRQHTVGLFIKALLKQHDQSRFEVFAYANNHEVDAVTEEIQAVTTYRPIGHLNDEQAVTLIQQDKIDVLVDLSGHTGRSRIDLFAWRPAPVLVEFLGYFSTTGLPYFDALLTDRWHTTPQMQEHFVEPLVELEGGRFNYQPVPFAPEVSPPPCLERGYVTFGSFNNHTKYHAGVYARWAEILKQVPDSRLLLKSGAYENMGLRNDVLEAFAEHGIEPERIELRGRSSHEEMLAEYSDIDIALDPFPFTGGMSSCEALWMGPRS